VIETSARRLAVILAVLGLAGGLGLAAVLPWGAGLTHDSAFYVAAARNLLGGRGLSVSFDPRQFLPLTHYPPLYPAVLAGVGLSGIDPVDGARWLGAVLFAANVVMTGTLAYLASHSIGAAASTALLFMSAPPMALVHTMAWSEPLFIACEISALLFLACYLKEPHVKLLVAAAVAAALAWLARYAGVALVATGALAIAWHRHGSWKKSLIRAAVFALLGCLPMAAWQMRNYLVGGTTTNRILMFHPPTRASLSVGFDAIAGWFFPTVGSLRPALLIFLMFICAYAFLAWRSSATGLESDHRDGKVDSLAFLWIGSYLAVLLLSVAFFDAGIPFDSRILAPLYPPLLVLGTDPWTGLPASSDKGRRLRIVGVVLAAIIFCSQIAGTKSSLGLGYHEGIGYASRAWRGSPLARRLTDMRRAPVFTNAPDAVYLVTALPASGIPAKVDPHTNLPNASYPAELEAFRVRLETESGTLAYFNTIWSRWNLPSEAELTELLDLRVLAREADGVIYEARKNGKIQSYAAGEKTGQQTSR